MLFLRFLRFFEGQDILKFDADCGARALGLMNRCGIVYRCPGREEDGSVRVEISHSDRQKVVSLLDKNGIRVYIICERGFPALVSPVSYTHLMQCAIIGDLKQGLSRTILTAILNAAFLCSDSAV